MSESLGGAAAKDLTPRPKDGIILQARPKNNE
jgi:hypothetical protein